MAFIYNPNAGKALIRENLSEILHVFSEGDYEVTVVPTKHKNHCCEYISSRGEHFDTVTVSGGDGTVNEAFNALMCIDEQKRPVLGYIPTGTTNDFASSVSIPKEIIEAARIVNDGEEKKIDVGKFNEKYFSYIAAFGAFTSVAYDTPQQSKNLLGYVAYILEGIKRLGEIKPYKIRIETENETYEDEFIFGMVTNARSVGGVKVKHFDISLSDGVFEGIFLKKITKPADLSAIVTDLRKNMEKSDHYVFIKAQKLKIESYENIAWTLDGEFGGEHTSVQIENIPQAIKIKVARE
ncbi:MAG: diacylglycerol/lipid kinase family protein [Clostridia bacterium]